MSLADGTAWEKEHPVQAAITEPPLQEESDELIEEVASTTILYESFGRFIQNLDQALAETVDISFDGNPVRTHGAITGLHEELIMAAHQLRDELIEKLAQFGDQITTAGSTLRTQVLNDDETGGVVIEEDPALIFNKTGNEDEEIPF